MFQLSSEDAVQAYIARVKEVNPYLNAVVEDRFQDAVREAQEVDKLVTSHCKTEQEIEKETPLLGVPFTVKESCSVKGCIKVKLSLICQICTYKIINKDLYAMDGPLLH